MSICYLIFRLQLLKAPNGSSVLAQSAAFDWTSCKSPFPIRGLNYGHWAFSLMATDRAGNKQTYGWAACCQNPYHIALFKSMHGLWDYISTHPLISPLVVVWKSYTPVVIHQECLLLLHVAGWLCTIFGVYYLLIVCNTTWARLDTLPRTAGYDLALIACQMPDAASQTILPELSVNHIFFV